MNDINTIIDEKDKKTYWVHRTSLKPLFINYNSENNGLPLLLTFKEFCALEDNTNVFGLPIGLWQQDVITEENSDYIEKLEKNGITKEMYQEKVRENYQEQLQSFFENGLYVYETDLERTATSLESGKKNESQEEKLKKIILEPNFGFNAGDSLLGGMSNREELNTLLILEIPKECFTKEDTMQLFEITDEQLLMMTSYHGPQTTSTVIPPEYIKCAIIREDSQLLEFSNDSFDKEYQVSRGIYNKSTLDKIIDNMQKEDYNYDKIVNIIKMINSDLDTKFNFSEYRNRINKVLEMISKGFEIDNRSYELNKETLLKLEEVRKSFRTELEVLSEDLTESDMTELSEDEIVQKIEKFLAVGTETLAFHNEKCDWDKFYNELEIFNNGLNIFDDNVLKKISYNSKYNDIVGNVNMKKRILGELHKANDVDAYLLGESLGLSELPEDLKNKINKNDNESFLLRSALATTDTIIAQKIIKFMKNSDISVLSIEECQQILDGFVGKSEGELEMEQPYVEEKSDETKSYFTDGMRKDAQKYRAILNHYACMDIAKDLSDEAIYDLMYTINWTGGEDYSRYYYEYKSAEKDEEKLKELKEKYVLRTKKLLQKSGYDEKEIEDKISEGYADKVSGLHCWAGGLQCMFEDFFGPKEQIEKYMKQLEEDMKKQDTEEREVSVSEVKEVAVTENITSRNNVIKAINSSENKKKEEQTHTDE